MSSPEQSAPESAAIPVPSPATPAEHAAAEGIARLVNDWDPDDGAYDLARAALDGLRTNGYAVVELPEPTVREASLAGTQRAFIENATVTVWPDNSVMLHLEDRLEDRTWLGIPVIRHDAAIFLALAAWAERQGGEPQC